MHKKDIRMLEDMAIDLNRLAAKYNNILELNTEEPKRKTKKSSFNNSEKKRERESTDSYLFVVRAHTESGEVKELSRNYIGDSLENFADSVDFVELLPNNQRAIVSLCCEDCKDLCLSKKDEIRKTYGFFVNPYKNKK
jgi:hypothetical protein